jgi:hypothetical protein
MKSKSFFALLLAVYAFFGAMVFSQSENATPDSTSIQEDLSVFLPDIQLLSIFQEKEEELDALGASRSRFTDIARTLIEYQGMASQKREYQEKALVQIHSLQKSIKNNTILSQNEKQKLEQDIITLMTEKGNLEKKQEETQALLKKFYQQ